MHSSENTPTVRESLSRLLKAMNSEECEPEANQRRIVNVVPTAMANQTEWRIQEFEEENSIGRGSRLEHMGFGIVDPGDRAYMVPGDTKKRNGGRVSAGGDELMDDVVGSRQGLRLEIIVVKIDGGDGGPQAAKSAGKDGGADGVVGGEKGEDVVEKEIGEIAEVVRVRRRRRAAEGVIAHAQLPPTKRRLRRSDGSANK